MHKKYSLLLMLLCFVSNISIAQNTVGTLLNTTDSEEGYTLFTPFTNNAPFNTYLINNCGETVNTWASDFPGQGSDRIQEDGTLFRGANDNQSNLSYFGNNGRLEHFDWDGNLIWGFTYSQTNFSFHHDYTVLPNGNVLLLVVERRSLDQAIAAGRDPNSLLQDELYTEKIVEIEPTGINGGNVVWEWDFFDHLIQDFDATQDNFGVVANHPELLDINYTNIDNFDGTNNADWIHTNAIDYNETLDQIVISGRGTSEFYIIDHSTTTAEAATSSGGNSGKGGDFLYRWGNPQAYDRGTPDQQQLFGQHTVHWIPDGFPNEGNFMTFNNGFGRGYSSIEIIEQPTPDSDGNYPIGSDAFLPNSPNTVYDDQGNPGAFNSPFVSSAYMLEGGNIIIDSGNQGRIFEVNTNGDIVWEYLNPVSINNGVSTQGGDPPVGNDSRVFRARRYPIDYIGFNGFDVAPDGYVELDPVPANCELLSVEDFESAITLSASPNPVSNILEIQSRLPIEYYKLYDLSGKLLLQGIESKIDLSKMSDGLYILEATIDSQSIVKKIVKH